MSYAIRPAARALIVREDRILVIRMRDPGGIFHVLPGGGLRHGEALRDGLRRECREELGVDVEVGEMAYLREYIGRNHAFSPRHRNFHQLEVVFFCTLPPEIEPGKGHEHDRKQVGFDWLPVDQLERRRFLPAAAVPHIRESLRKPNPRYLGDIN